MKGYLVQGECQCQFTNFVFLAKVSGGRDLVVFAFPPYPSPLLQRVTLKHDTAISLLILPGLNHAA